jgi:hypothetical protein
MPTMTSEEKDDRSPDGAGEPWWRRAEELAEWADRTLVNRRDVYGGQYVTSWGAIKRTTRHDWLTRGHLAWHFAAEGTRDVLGLHATAPDETCRWLALDIDLHEGRGGSLEANLLFALEVLTRARGAGLDVRLVDSSGGRGGYHAWVVFDRPISMADARRLVLWLARDWAEHGLPQEPDLFPGNDHLTGKGCGNWLRLLGRHHKRPSWATVWSPERQAWLAGDEAIDALLTLRGRPVDVASIVPAEFDTSKPKPPPKPPGPRKVASPVGGPESPRGSSAPARRHRRAGGGGREARLARASLAFYRNDDLDYDDWLAVGMALRDLDDEAAAFALWDDWSATSSKHDPEVTAAKWQSLRPAGESGGIGLGTLYRRAIEAGWSGPDFEVTLGLGGVRRMAHRSGCRGTISIPARVVRAPAPSGRDDDEASGGPATTRGRREGA